MKMQRISTRTLSIAAFVLSFVTLISSNLYFAASESNEISGCVNKKSGALRIANKCSSAERVISWNKTGPQGIQGEAGPKGDVGPQGETGAVGPQGETGAVGPQGIKGEKGDRGEVGPSGTSVVTTQTAVQKVYDSTGAFMGNSVGVVGSQVTVQIGNSRFTYQDNGYISLTGELIYPDSNCLGTKYVPVVIGGTSNWSIAAPLVSVPGSDLRRSTLGLFFGVTVGSMLPVPDASFRYSFDRAGVLGCRPFDMANELSGVYQVTNLGISVPHYFSPPFSLRN